MKRLFIFLLVITFLGIVNKANASFWVGSGGGELRLQQGYIPFGQGSTQTVGTDSNLFWNNTNRQLNIGTGTIKQNRGQRLNLSGRNTTWFIGSYLKEATSPIDSEAFIINLYDSINYNVITYTTVLISRIGEVWLGNSSGKIIGQNFVTLKTYDDGTNINIYVTAPIYCDYYTLDVVYNRLNTPLDPVIVGTDTYVPVGTLTGNTATAPYYMNVGDATRLTILSDGKVGINTINPTSELDVKGTLRLSGATSGYVGLSPASSAGSTIYTLPSADGSLGQVLSTNGTGGLSWINNGSGTGGSISWSALTSPTSNLDLAMFNNTTQITYGASTGTSNLFKMQDTTNNTGTGYLFQLATTSGSSLNPFSIIANDKKILTVNSTGDFNISGEPVSFDATGGEISYSGNYKIHIFKNGGTFTPNGTGTVEYLIVAGGGGGGGKNTGGGGGAGGLLQGTITVTSQAYSIVVGTGGAGGTSIGLNGTDGSDGENSSFASKIAIGGGGGGHGVPPNVNTPGHSGGSGGGGGGLDAGQSTGGAGTAGQGNAGGSSQLNAAFAGGGGGAGAAGGNAGGNLAGDGGNGIQSNISGVNTWYAGGGGGGGNSDAGSGGLGGGGAGGFGNPASQASSGTPNTGGGGGGAGGYETTYPGGNGGSGIVIIRYPTTPKILYTSISSGNVGIGNDSPTNAKLVVNGGIAIGGDIVNNIINTVSSGNGSTQMYIGNSTINVTAPSDINIKQNIRDTKYGLKDLNKLSIKDFEYKQDFINDNQKIHTGMIAQELEIIYPEAVSIRSDGLRMINYEKLIPLIIKANQDLKDIIDNLETRITILEKINSIPSRDKRRGKKNE